MGRFADRAMNAFYVVQQCCSQHKGFGATLLSQHAQVCAPPETHRCACSHKKGCSQPIWTAKLVQQCCSQHKGFGATLLSQHTQLCAPPETHRCACSHKKCCSQHMCTAKRVQQCCCQHRGFGATLLSQHTQLCAHLFSAQPCTDPTPVHCSNILVKTHSPVVSAVLQHRLTAGLCHCKYMDICSAASRALTQQQCTAALLFSKCIPQCSVLLCNTG